MIAASPFTHFEYFNCPRVSLLATKFEATQILTLLKMASLYDMFDWNTASTQELEDQIKKLQRDRDLRKLQSTIRDSIRESIRDSTRAETLKEGISLKIENEDGRVYISLPFSHT